MQVEAEGGDDAEVPPAAADRPEEVWVLVRAGANLLPACEYDLGLEQVVDRQSALAREVTEAATEREAADPGRRDDSARDCQAVLTRRSVDFSPRAAASDPGGAGPDVDLDRLQAREVEDDPVVDGAEAGAVVGAASDCQQQVVSGGERDDRGNVFGAGGGRDQRGPAIDHRVVDRSSGLVAWVLRGGEVAAESGRSHFGRSASGCRRRASFPPGSCSTQPDRH